ncbi:MAG: PspA/IM30 family protein [Deltaproteobacteria bacterium]|nr:PspA/IM30 family protein [Deltaproteobacteria bacterium]
MTIFNRLGTLLKSNVNDAISKAEDPEKMLNQMLLDMQQQLVEAKKQVAVAIADEKRLAKQFEQEKTQAVEWEKKAMLAVKAGNDDLAKQALQRKTEHEKLAVGYEQQWQAQKTAVDQLKTALTGLNSKIEEARRKKNLLVARAKRAEAQRTIAETMDGLSNTSAFDTMSRMEEKINKAEAEAQATYELAQTASGDDLKAKFDALENVEADDALAALKAKMGVAPAAQAQPAMQEQQSLEDIEKQIEAELAAKR